MYMQECLLNHLRCWDIMCTRQFHSVEFRWQMMISGKFAWIVLIPKKGDLSLPENYCPISILSLLSKLLERHVYQIISNHLLIHHPISDRQWGYSHGKSTTTALLSFSHDINKSTYISFKQYILVGGILAAFNQLLIVQQGSQGERLFRHIAQVVSTM